VADWRLSSPNCYFNFGLLPIGANLQYMSRNETLRSGAEG
jgi:hypothetical protein